MQKPVIVIGGGLAGMTAAYTACREGGDVLLIDRGSIGIGTNSALSNGVFGGPFVPREKEDYISDTLQVGRMLNHQPLVRRVADGAPAAFEFLRSIGCTVKQTVNYYHVVEPPNPTIIPGMPLVKKLAQAIVESGRIRLLTGFYVTDLLRDGEKVSGVRGFDRRGKELSIYAPAVVMASGGAGAIYEMNDNQRSMFGQGYYLAARAGLELLDMEFVQFIPIILAAPHLPRMLLFSPYPAGTRLINTAGEDLTEKYGVGDLNDGVRRKRDFLSIMLFQEGCEGPVFIDYRQAPPPAWEAHPLSLLAKKRFDFRQSPVRVSPGAHFFMGGVEVDEHGETALSGLFACGEIVWGVHGANRRGGNALTECLVLGEIVGRHAAKHASDKPAGLRFSEKQTNSIGLGLTGSGKLNEIRTSIRKIAWDTAGIVRSQTGLQKGLSMVEDIVDRLGQVEPENIRQVLLKQDLTAASFTVKAVLVASLARTESRGSFYRSDFPLEDGANWLKNSCLSYSPERDHFSLCHRALTPAPLRT